MRFIHRLSGNDTWAAESCYHVLIVLLQIRIDIAEILMLAAAVISVVSVHTSTKMRRPVFFSVLKYKH
eukprot:m.48315 g.48315  ORF g.48315 m.48315 type:complete len:68 (-) comp11025_c0_seq3:519-722(-)